MPLMFEKQPRESARAFAAFSLYLSLGPQRSLAEVSQKSAKSIPLLKRWSRKFDWAGRVAAYGAHLAIVERLVDATAGQGEFYAPFLGKTEISAFTYYPATQVLAIYP